MNLIAPLTNCPTFFDLGMYAGQLKGVRVGSSPGPGLDLRRTEGFSIKLQRLRFHEKVVRSREKREREVLLLDMVRFTCISVLSCAFR